MVIVSEPTKAPGWLHPMSLNVVENDSELLAESGWALFNETNAGGMENPELGFNGSMNMRPKVDMAWLGTPGPRGGLVGGTPSLW